jgi:chaperonin cofactor prefoldin
MATNPALPPTQTLGKPYLCKTCGDRNGANFKPGYKSTCKRCTYLRTKALHGGQIRTDPSSSRVETENVSSSGTEDLNQKIESLIDRIGHCEESRSDFELKTRSMFTSDLNRIETMERRIERLEEQNKELRNEIERPKRDHLRVPTGINPQVEESKEEIVKPEVVPAFTIVTPIPIPMPKLTRRDRILPTYSPSLDR